MIGVPITANQRIGLYTIVTSVIKDFIAFLLYYSKVFFYVIFNAWYPLKGLMINNNFKSSNK